MALLKTGVRYPIAIVSSFTYSCPICKIAKTILADEEDESDICPCCGEPMRLVSSHTETKKPNSK